MDLFNLTFDKGNENNVIIDKFVDEYSQWTVAGNVPEIASLDVNYALELQKHRLDEHNAKIETVFSTKDSTFKDGAVKCFTVPDKGDYQTVIGCKDYKTTETVYVNNKKKRKSKIRQNLYVAVTRLLNQNADGALACPNCGAVSGIRELLTGCKSCGTRFIINDLFPKVTNFYAIKEVAGGKKVVKNSAIAVVLITMFAFAGSLFFINYKNGNLLPENSDFIMNIIICTLYGLIGGAFCGYLLWGLGMFMYLIFGAIKSMFLLGPHIKAKTKLPKLMRQIDPNFSYEFFIGKVINLIKLMIFSDDYTNLAAYDGKAMQNKFKDIIDVKYDSTVKFNGFKINGSYCYVDITAYTTVLKIDCGDVKKAKEKFRIVVCKNINAIADAGFSIKKVSCKSCGGSFDATREHNCPYCGNPYHLGNDDWVVIEFNKE